MFLYLFKKELISFEKGTNLEARLNMLIAALYGAKAFRKGCKYDSN